MCPSQLTQPRCLGPGSVTRVPVPSEANGAAASRVSAGSLGAGAWQETAVGTKGPLLRSFVCCQVVADVRDAPDLPGPLGTLGAPAPSPGRPRAAQAPHAAARSLALGLEGRLDGVSRWHPKCPGLESGGGERRWTPLPLKGGGGSAWSWGLQRKLGAAKILEIQLGASGGARFPPSFPLQPPIPVQ